MKKAQPPKTPALLLLTPDEREAYEERAAIVEHEAGFRREDAEARAFRMVLDERRHR